MTRAKSFTIGAVPPSLNKLMRMHWAERRRLQARLTKEISVLAREAGIPEAKEKEFRRLHITTYRPRRFDDDNNIGGAKLLVDSLRKAGVIYQDSPRYLQSIYTQEIDRKHPRTEIVVRLGGKA